MKFPPYFTREMVFSKDFLIYGVGYLLALLLTFGSFLIIYYNFAAPETEFGLILAFALLQVLVHMRCFLHLSLQRSARSDLMLILFATSIICFMVAGTLIVLFNQDKRMM